MVTWTPFCNPYTPVAQELVGLLMLNKYYDTLFPCVYVQNTQNKKMI